MAVRSRQLKDDEEKIRCRRCRQLKHPREFYGAVDLEIDTNGKFSVCSTCIDEMYSNLFSGNGNMEKSILSLCRSLNVLYNQDAVDAARQHIETMRSNGKNVSSVFGIYKNKIAVTNTGQVGNRDAIDLTYRDNPTIITSNNEETEQYENIDELKEFWGQELSSDDLAYLQNEYNNFKKTNKADTYPEIVLLREVCFILLDMRNDRRANKSTANQMKSLQDLMKTLAIAPNMANEASGEKSMDAFGLWVKDIENLTPAEWTEDKSIYRDVDDIEKYAETFITSPLRNFVTGSRDFTMENGEQTLETDDEEDVKEG